MIITSYVPAGFDGEVVWVEVDIRRGIPGIDIVGLPDGAVKEAKERVRVSVRNSGYSFPPDRILINLAPAGVRKEGASFDLPMAVSILHRSGQIPPLNGFRMMLLGELQLSGRVRPVKGVLSAVASGLKKGIGMFFVPWENLEEALALNEGEIFGVKTLRESVNVLKSISAGERPEKVSTQKLKNKEHNHHAGDFSDIKGNRFLKRALEVAAAGMHHVFMFGPPGSGKTMAARRLPSILPPLSREDSITVTRIYSLAGKLRAHESLLTRPPFRSPHHSATQEGLIGGGRVVKPGEVSLAHRGVLFLDEAPEFRKSLLQGLREPVEKGRVDIARAGASYWFPAEFQLIMAGNPCPCGNLGKDNGICVCSAQEINRYWKKLGGALLDRIDIRIPLKPAPPEQILSGEEESSRQIRERVERAIKIQERRFSHSTFSRNSRMTADCVERYCSLSKETAKIFVDAVKKLSLSSRACHSVLKVARTIADLEGTAEIKNTHILEAIQHRRYGENDIFWNVI
ncbi:MAG: ATP-binding protein [Spirochaetes bacterium]|nr:MAG: ATP-binding protein [Spirochaetota bacterium]